MVLKSFTILALATVAGVVLSSPVRAEVYLVGFRTVYVIPAHDPYEEQRYEMDRAYAVAYEEVVAQEEADLRTVDDLAQRHPRDADLLDRMRDRICGDIDESLDAAARHRDETLAGWYTSAPNVYEACPEMVAVYRRERPVNVVEVKFSKGHRNDTYILREPYRAHHVEPMEGMAYGRRLKGEVIRQEALVPPSTSGRYPTHVHYGGISVHHAGGPDDPPVHRPGDPHPGPKGRHDHDSVDGTPPPKGQDGKHPVKDATKKEEGKPTGKKSDGDGKEGGKKKGNG